MAPPFSMSRLWHHVSIPDEVDGFVIPSPTWLPRFVHIFILSLSSFSLSLFSLSPFLSLFSFFSPPQRRSLSRRRAGSLSPSLSLFSPPQRRSLSLSLFLSSLSSLPLSDGLSSDGEHGLSLSLPLFLSSLSSLSAMVSLSPSLSLFSFFSPPQRRSLSRRRARSLSPSLSLFSFFSPPHGLSRDGEHGLSLSLSFSLLFLLSPSATVSLATESTVSLSPPLFLSSLSSLPLSDGLSLSLSFSLLFLLSRSATVSLSLSPSLSLSDRTNFLLNSGNYSKRGSGGGDRGRCGKRVRERRVQAAEGDSLCWLAFLRGCNRNGGGAEPGHYHCRAPARGFRSGDCFNDLSSFYLRIFPRSNMRSSRQYQWLPHHWWPISVVPH